MFTRFMMFGGNHPLMALLIMAALTLPALAGLPGLVIDTGFSRLISDVDPDKPTYNRIALMFGSDNKTIVYVRDPELWTEAKLTTLEQLHIELEQLPFVDRVESLFSAQDIRDREGLLDFYAVLPAVLDHPGTIASAREDALRNPLLANNLISVNENAVAILVTVTEDSHDDQFDLKAYQAMQRVIDPTKTTFQEVFQVGAPRINAEVKQQLLEDITLLGPLSGAVLFASLLFFLRNPLAALLPLATSGLSILWTFGMMGWFGVPINILTVMLPSLVVVIGATEDTFMLASYLEEVTDAGKKAVIRKQATRRMMKHMGSPLILTTLTTALGFSSNLLSPIGMIRDFALSATFAIVANGLVSVLAIPMLLATIGPTPSPRSTKSGKAAGLPGLPGMMATGLRWWSSATRKPS